MATIGKTATKKIQSFQKKVTKDRVKNTPKKNTKGK